jgi:hypothetical protein
MNEDDLDRRLELTWLFQHLCNGNIPFQNSIVWANVANYTLNGAVNGHSCVFWFHENLHITGKQAIDLSRISV